MPRAVDPGPPPVDYDPLAYKGLELPGIRAEIPKVQDLFNDWLQSGLNDFIRDVFGIDINDWFGGQDIWQQWNQQWNDTVQQWNQNWATSVQQWNDLLAAWNVQTTQQLEAAWKNLLALFGTTPEELNKAVSEFDPWKTLDGWMTPGLQEVIDSIYAGWSNWGEIGHFFGRGINDVAQSIYGIFDTGLTAQNRISDLMTRLAPFLEGAGTIILDTFNRPPILDALGVLSPSNATPGGNYTVTRSGPGGGNIGVLKQGHMGWVAYSGITRYDLARHHQIMDSDSGHMSTVFTSKIEPGTIATASARNYFVCRANAEMTDFIELVITTDRVWLRHHGPGGVINDIIPPGAANNPTIGLYAMSGDLWEFDWGGGIAANQHRYVLRRNGITVFDEIDWNARATVGPPATNLNRFVGFGYQAENAFLVSQCRGASLGIFTAVNLPEVEEEHIPEYTLPFTETDVPRLNQPIPANAVGCWVQLVGGGGAGGRGLASSADRGGGGGGSGAAVIQRGYISRQELGNVYSVSRGLGGSFGDASTASVFTSGDVVLIAEGGNPGANGATSGFAAGGAAVQAAISGVSGFVTRDGAAGGNGGSGTAGAGNQIGSPGSNATTGGCPGGGGGGGVTGTGLAWGTGGAGGNSATAAGGAQPVANTAAHGNNGANGAGASAGGGGSGGPVRTNWQSGRGGNGGSPGAGGGGSSGTNLSIYLQNPGVGGDGTTIVEWV